MKETLLLLNLLIPSEGLEGLMERIPLPEPEPIILQQRVIRRYDEVMPTNYYSKKYS